MDTRANPGCGMLFAFVVVSALGLLIKHPQYLGPIALALIIFVALAFSCVGIGAALGSKN